MEEGDFAIFGTMPGVNIKIQSAGFSIGNVWSVGTVRSAG